MIVVLTALDLERRAVLEHLENVTLHRHSMGTMFRVGALAGRPDCRVAVALLGKGTNETATITNRAIAEFVPDAVLFVGIAGALWRRISLGDVVVATKIYAYHGGRVDADGYHAAPRAFEATYDLRQLAQEVAFDGTWWAHGADSPVPEVHFEPIATGEVLLDGNDTPLRAHLRSHYADAAAIDMESAGMAHAAHLNRATPMLSVRGISDFADGTKVATDAENTRETAARNAARFAAALLGQMYDMALTSKQEPHAEMGPTDVGSQANNDDGGFTNIGANNGTQINTMHGDLTVSQAFEGPRRHSVLGGDLISQVSRITDAVAAAQRTGVLDLERYSAAMLQLDNLNRSLKQGRAGAGHARAAVADLQNLLGDLPGFRARFTDLLRELS